MLELLDVLLLGRINHIIALISSYVKIFAYLILRYWLIFIILRSTGKLAGPAIDVFRASTCSLKKALMSIELQWHERLLGKRKSRKNDSSATGKKKKNNKTNSGGCFL